jgi:hypothetical protein
MKYSSHSLLSLKHKEFKCSSYSNIKKVYHYRYFPWALICSAFLQTTPFSFFINFFLLLIALSFSFLNPPTKFLSSIFHVCHYAKHSKKMHQSYLLTLRETYDLKFFQLIICYHEIFPMSSTQNQMCQICFTFVSPSKKAFNQGLHLFLSFIELCEYPNKLSSHSTCQGSNQ